VHCHRNAAHERVVVTTTTSEKPPRVSAARRPRASHPDARQPGSMPPPELAKKPRLGYRRLEKGGHPANVGINALLVGAGHNIRLLLARPRVILSLKVRVTHERETLTEWRRLCVVFAGQRFVFC
jgi:hypothetical protein